MGPQTAFDLLWKNPPYIPPLYSSKLIITIQAQEHYCTIIDAAEKSCTLSEQRYDLGFRATDLVLDLNFAALDNRAVQESTTKQCTENIAFD